LLSLLPLYITGRILLFVFELIDGPLGKAINGAIQKTTGWEAHIPGLGLIGTAALVLAVGWLTRHVVFQRAQSVLDEFIGQIPIVRSLYNASRQIVVPFADQSKLPFSQVILAQYPMPGRWTLGLVAREHISEDADDPRMVIFFPTNHLHLGYPVVMSRHEVQRIDMSMEEAVKFFVSCGVVGDENLLKSGGKEISWDVMNRQLDERSKKPSGEAVQLGKAEEARL
jgi:uncharacterized membrane protein